MKNNKNKTVFEPVSAEEAKKIRAYRENIITQSGAIDCGSGSHDPYSSCIGKPEGVECCVTRPNGQNEIGICANASGTDGNLMCITDPTQVPDKPIKPDPDVPEN